MQNVIDFVNWFKSCRSPDIDVGITKIRQVTFQMRSAEHSAGGDAPAAAAAGGAQQQDAAGPAADPPPAAGCTSAQCMACDFVDLLLSLPASIRQGMNRLMEPFGLQCPEPASSKKRSFAAKYANAAKNVKKPRRDMTVDDADLEYRMTCKVSMWVVFSFGPDCYIHTCFRFLRSLMCHRLCVRIAKRKFPEKVFREFLSSLPTTMAPISAARVFEEKKAQMYRTDLTKWQR